MGNSKTIFDLNIVIQNSPIRPALLDTEDASSVLIYDSLGALIFFVLVLPGGAGSKSFLTSDINDPDFHGIARNAGLRLTKSQ